LPIYEEGCYRTLTIPQCKINWKFLGFFNAVVADFLVATGILVIAGTLFLRLPSVLMQVSLPLLAVQLCHSCLTAASMLLVTLLLLAYLQLLAVLLQLLVLQLLAVLLLTSLLLSAFWLLLGYLLFPLKCFKQTIMLAS
jgi:hypothetical protein